MATPSDPHLPPSGPTLVGPSDADDREALIRDPALREELMRYFRRKVPEADVEDLVQRTLFAVSQATHFPTGREEQRQYLFAIARNEVRDYYRKAVRRPEIDDGADADEVAQAADADPVADRDLLEKLARDLPENYLVTLRWLALHSLGESLNNIAYAAKVPPDVVYKRVSALKARLNVSARVLAGLTIIALILGGYYLLRPRPQIAHHEPQTVSTQEPASDTQTPVPSATPEPDPIEQAHQLREKAFGECLQDSWYKCLDDLNAARSFDLAGDSDPPVKAARKDATEALQHTEDKQQVWWPPKVRGYGPKGSP